MGVAKREFFCVTTTCRKFSYVPTHRMDMLSYS